MRGSFGSAVRDHASCACRARCWRLLSARRLLPKETLFDIGYAAKPLTGAAVLCRLKVPLGFARRVLIGVE